jgi:drug/metabolite transporter (DMT)-like permease
VNEKFLGWAALFGIYAALVLDIFSTTNSSPQTTELFARERSGTLWRWVRAGAIMAVAFTALGAWMAWKDKKENVWGPLAGGLLALGVMWAMYSYALKKGGGSKGGKHIEYADW